MRPTLVGESNPYHADPKWALYPYAGYPSARRLCVEILDLQRADYLRRFERVNLCCGAWSIREARERARVLQTPPGSLDYHMPGYRPPVLVLLGSKVCAAFGVPFEPFTVNGEPCTVALAILPHPSGLCRIWNEPGSFERARETLRKAGAL